MEIPKSVCVFIYIYICLNSIINMSISQKEPMSLWDNRNNFMVKPAIESGIFLVQRNTFLNNRYAVNRYLFVIKYLMSTYGMSGTLPATEPCLCHSQTQLGKIIKEIAKMCFLCSFNDTWATKATSLDSPLSLLYLTQVDSPWPEF